ncbi:hypothetical protein BS78_10G037100 [Paspalum vaginatum]|nr:hypothetical protein BS78_10G037100 [Paspalum vaginatum]
MMIHREGQAAGPKNRSRAIYINSLCPNQQLRHVRWALGTLHAASGTSTTASPWVFLAAMTTSSRGEDRLFASARVCKQKEGSSSQPPIEVNTRDKLERRTRDISSVVVTTKVP